MKDKIFEISFFIKDGKLFVKDESCKCCGTNRQLPKEELDKMVEDMARVSAFLTEHRSKAQ